ncbi:unnamed protein product, partial [marine sediment metagenome]
MTGWHRSEAGRVARLAPGWEAGMTLLVVGTVAIDKVETPYGSREAELGGSAVYFSFAASCFSP